jgi:hypothetical protein
MSSIAGALLKHSARNRVVLSPNRVAWFSKLCGGCSVTFEQIVDVLDLGPRRPLTADEPTRLDLGLELFIGESELFEDLGTASNQIFFGDSANPGGHDCSLDATSDSPWDVAWFAISQTCLVLTRAAVLVLVLDDPAVRENAAGLSSSCVIVSERDA